MSQSLQFSNVSFARKGWLILGILSTGESELHRWWGLIYTKITILSPTSSNCPHNKVTNITVSYIPMNSIMIWADELVNPKLEYFDDQNESTSLKTLSKSAWQSTECFSSKVVFVTVSLATHSLTRNRSYMSIFLWVIFMSHLKWIIEGKVWNDFSKYPRDKNIFICSFMFNQQVVINGTIWNDIRHQILEKWQI